MLVDLEKTLGKIRIAIRGIEHVWTKSLFNDLRSVQSYACDLLLGSFNIPQSVPEIDAMLGCRETEYTLRCKYSFDPL